MSEPAPGSGPARRTSGPGAYTPSGDGVSTRPHYTPPPPRGTPRRADAPPTPRPATTPATTPPRDRPDAQPSSPWSDRVRARASTFRETETAGRRRGLAPERGLAGWQALVLLLILAGIGGLIDLLTGTAVRGGFNYGIIIASLVAILAVRRSGMFPVVVAPPIVYFLASAVLLLVRSKGLSDRGAALDVAINWLVYGFPAIAAASAIVLIVAGVRMIINR